MNKINRACLHREEEGRDLLGKRTMDFKVSYLDAGLTNSYFSDSDSLGSGSCMGSQLTSQQQQQNSQQSQQSNQQQSPQPQPQRVNRRYKTQLRDFLSTCRSKRASKLGTLVFSLKNYHQTQITHTFFIFLFSNFSKNFRDYFVCVHNCLKSEKYTLNIKNFDHYQNFHESRKNDS